MLKYNEDYLWQEYGIVKLANEDDMYSVPVVSVSTEDKYYKDGHGIKRVYLPKLEDGCLVSLFINYKENTLDIVSCIDGVPGMCEGKIVLENDSNEPLEFEIPLELIRPQADYYGISDDLRYYACHHIAEKIRKKGYKDILVEFRLIFDGEQVIDWIEG